MPTVVHWGLMLGSPRFEAPTQSKQEQHPSQLPEPEEAMQPSEPAPLASQLPRVQVGSSLTLRLKIAQKP